MPLKSSKIIYFKRIRWSQTRKLTYITATPLIIRPATTANDSGNNNKPNVVHKGGFSRPTNDQNDLNAMKNWSNELVMNPKVSTESPKAIVNSASSSSKEVDNSNIGTTFKFISNERQICDELGKLIFDVLKTQGLKECDISRPFQMLINKYRDEDKIFPLKYILPLLRYVKPKGDTPDLILCHKLYDSYRPYMDLLKQNDSISYFEYISMMIKIEYKLKNFQTCEKLFSEYIQCNQPKQEILLVGLKSFIANNNIQLAKEFYIQVLTNEDNFPMTSWELYGFLKELDKYSDFTTIDWAFKLWIQLKCKRTKDIKEIPNHKTLQLIHKAYLMTNDIVALKKFWELDAIKSSNYRKNILSEITEFIQNIYKNKPNTLANPYCNTIPKDNTVNNKIENSHLSAGQIEYFLKKLPNDNALAKNNSKLNYNNNNEEISCTRYRFYEMLLKAYIKTNNLIQMKEILILVSDDEKLPSHEKPSLHFLIFQLFMKNGSFKELYPYFRQLINEDKLPLKPEYFFLVWECAIQSYPMEWVKYWSNLKKKLLTGNSDMNDAETTHSYISIFPWLNGFIKKYSQVYEKKINGSETINVSSLREDEFRNLEKFNASLKKKKYKECELIILNSIRDGKKPHFEFYYHILKRCLMKSKSDQIHANTIKYDMEENVMLARLADDIIRNSYHYIPLKMDILWLRREIEVLFELNNPKTNSLKSVNFNTEILNQMRLIDNKLKDFIKLHELQMNFQNYLQLSNICIKVRHYELSKFILTEKARKIIDASNSFQWSLYYMEIIRVHCLTIDATSVLQNLKEWNDNVNATIRSRDIIRNVKNSLKYFSSSHVDKGSINLEVQKEIYDEVEKLTRQFIDNKIDGRKQLKRLCNFLPTWLDTEMGKREES
ncbi:Pet111p NDAI_0K00620 [Naumovozyma dairenensis CBS 421]|uniref:Uncharacterized protein n=1 Tax=Naumovozyma dairenensis (strain ATCC 10597 / BCRC 20456 / CBS 421 / NBRC 0211 / NRRL Y-12639) TaxID=1071378 RepID=G0WHJ2_NAUDC|nr:hypothetical protein NDAI_0K00620 [Naumovozyma dairenensis CBS 421]CCD27253.1 hypothetical protein NDAI_0K00620 [Naumovozyma dairenensis CBS 421]